MLIYLDTSHLQKWHRRGLDEVDLVILDSLRDSRDCKFILSLLHVLDMTKGTDIGKAIQLAAFLDTLPVQWFDNPVNLKRAEMRSAISRFNGADQLQVNPFVGHYIDTLELDPLTALEMRLRARSLSLQTIVCILMGAGSKELEGGINIEFIRPWSERNSLRFDNMKNDQKESVIKENFMRVIRDDIISFQLVDSIHGAELSKAIINPVESFVTWLVENPQFIPGTWFPYSAQHQMHRDKTHKWVESDFDDYLKLDGNPEVRAFYPNGTLNADNVTANIKKNISFFKANGFGVFIAIELSSGKFVGRCGFGRLPAGEIEVGYTFLPEFWAKGLATEALAALLRWAQQNIYSVDTIVAYTPKDHIASQRVMQKAKMEFYKTEVSEIETCVFYKASLR